MHQRPELAGYLLGLAVEHLLDLVLVAGGVNHQSLSAELLARLHRADGLEPELLDGLAAETLLEEEQPLVREDDQALLLVVSPLAQRDDAFGGPEKVPQVADLLPPEHATHLAQT